MRGNATLLALVVVAAMTTASLQLWRLWSMHAAIMQEREAYYQSWFALNTCFDTTVRMLVASFDRYAQVAKQDGVCAIPLPNALQKGAVVCATMQYTKDDLFLVVVSMLQPQATKQTVRFLVEKKVYAQAPPQFVMHHVTFGVLI